MTITNRLKTGYATMLKIMSLVFYAWNDALSKQLTTHTTHPISPFFVVFFQYAIAGLIILPYLVRKKRIRLNGTKAGRYHLLRALLCTIGIVILNQSFQVMPLSFAVGFNLFSPCLTILCAYLFFSEKLTQHKAIGLLMSIIAYIIILDSRHHLAAPISFQQCLMPTIAMLCFQCNTMLTKQLSQKGESNLNLTMSLFITIPLLLLPLCFGSSWPTIQPSQYIILTQMALNGLLATYALHLAIASVDLTFLLPFGFLKYSIIALFGYLYFHEIPNNAHSIGIAITLVTLIFINYKQPIQKQTARGHLTT